MNSLERIPRHQKAHFTAAKAHFVPPLRGTHRDPKRVCAPPKRVPKCRFTTATAHLTGLKKAALQTTIFTQRIEPPAPNHYFYAADQKRARIPSDPGLQSALLSLQEVLCKKVPLQTTIHKVIKNVFGSPEGGPKGHVDFGPKFPEGPFSTARAHFGPPSSRKGSLSPNQGFCAAVIRRPLQTRTRV